MASVKSHHSPSLLIVEDDNAACEIIARMSSKEFPNCTIQTAGNGVAGLKLYKEIKPDIVITDVKMPEMDGIEMAREIRLIDDKATFIVLTAFNNKNYFDQFKEIGFCAYLCKPIDFKVLFAVIEKCSADLQL
jgi:YesN/AraC family two-component response regulator